MTSRLLQLKTDTDLDFMKEFLESAPKQMEEDYLFLSNAVREQNDKVQKFHAHKLKGLLVTIGADDAAAICSDIELHASTGNTTEVQILFTSLAKSMEELRQTLSRVSLKILDL